MQPDHKEQSNRSIIHIDMDCFFAAIEIRDRPELSSKPVAVGGNPSGRGVLTTCNYIARKYGCHSAMPAFKALELCPDLIILPVRHDLYREESHKIREIFKQTTTIIEPLSLDEAYLDVTHLKEDPSKIAQRIRQQIKDERGLTSSAGISPNKMLAKIASDWNKPDGQYQIKYEDITAFMNNLPVDKIWGVGKRTAEKLNLMGVSDCKDLQSINLPTLHQKFGKFGVSLYQLCRGIDDRDVITDRERKSTSVERTFKINISKINEAKAKFKSILLELKDDLTTNHNERKLKSAFVKLTFSDFQKTSTEKKSDKINSELFNELLINSWNRGRGKSVRLIGAGVRFEPKKSKSNFHQMNLFE
ncbi:MAG: DNA polymerase IV [Verrucomicrobiota bacterium]|nr:DNA polymerase IV [Verrucomicrobiota bacterium]